MATEADSEGFTWDYRLNPEHEEFDAEQAADLGVAKVAKAITTKLAAEMATKLTARLTPILAPTALPDYIQFIDMMHHNADSYATSLISGWSARNPSMVDDMIDCMLWKDGPGDADKEEDGDEEGEDVDGDEDIERHDEVTGPDAEVASLMEALDFHEAAVAYAGFGGFFNRRNTERFIKHTRAEILSVPSAIREGHYYERHPSEATKLAAKGTKKKRMAAAMEDRDHPDSAASYSTTAPESAVETAAEGTVTKKKKKKRATTEAPLDSSNTVAALKADYIKLMITKQKRELFRAQREFMRLEISKEEKGRMAIVHDLEGIRDNSEDCQCSTDADALLEYICDSEHNWADEHHQTGRKLLNEIVSTKTALKTLARLEEMVFEE
ncbi:hypothetical protein QBC39DRAFT_376625 [Podospora conica]|nr:hypothetical protein QBC39DRAFT_376625 [Schizothecium conicum]